jgi:putative FmdB family regulatory protein
MPLYDYVCDACGHSEERFQTIAEMTATKLPADCGTCGQLGAVRRKISAPAVQTDNTFFANVGTLRDQFGGNDRELKRVVSAAKRQGYTPNYTDFYCPSLANRPGDPKAFIPACGGRSYVRKLCEERGVSCEGMVNYKAPEGRPRPRVKLAERTIRRLMREAIRKDPGLASKKNELREQIIDRHAYKT